MLTPQEVSQHAFSKASFGGYNMAMVDEFLDQLTEDYTALYKENAVLKSKMKVLVDKVEEYRSTEDGMRKAILVAQKAADQMLSDAKEERAALMAKAEGEARAKIASMRSEAEAEQMRLNAAQNATAAYVAKVRELCQQELNFLGGLSDLAPAAPSPAAEAMRDIESSVQKIVEVQSPVAESAPRADEPEAEEIPSRFDDGQPELLGELKGDGGLYAELLELNITPGKRESREPRADSRRTERPYEESPVEDDDDEEVDEPTRRIDFDNLKFGKDIKF